MIQKKALFFSLFFLLVTINFNAQVNHNKTIDSLKLVLKNTKNISEKTVLLTTLSSYSGYISSDEAIKYAEKALFYAKTEKDSLKIADAYGNLGIAFEIKSDYVNALSNLYKALSFYKNLNNPKRLLDAYNNIGLIYVDLKNYNKGLYYYNKALQLSYQTKEKRNNSLLENNIGDVYLQKKQYNKALSYFYKSLITNKSLKDIEGVGLNLTNIGICYVNLKNYDRGMEMINKSILNYQDYNNLYNTYNIYELGRIHYFKALEENNPTIKKENLNKSLVYLNQSLVNFKKFNSLVDIQNTYFYLSKANKLNGYTTEALNYFENYSTIKDSIFSEESKKKLANLEFQTEIDLKNKEIEIHKLKISKDSKKLYFLIILSFAALLLLGLLLYLYISKIKTNKIISDINTQKDKFFSIIAHDLRGPFNGFLGLTELMAEDIDSLSTEEIKYAAVNMKSSAKNLFNLLENLLEWSRMVQNLIPFNPTELDLQTILPEIILPLQNSAHKKEINITTDLNGVQSIYADKYMIESIIRNMVMNAIKFTPKNGAIAILAEEDNTTCTIIIKDNGIGMSPKIVNGLFKLDVQNNRIGTEEETSTGLGLILCKEFIDKHKGKIKVESEEGLGSAFYLILPKLSSL